MNNLTNCTGDAIVPFDPLSLCNPDGSDSLIGLPCSSSIIGNIFLIAVYGFLLGKGAQWISEGSDLLLRVWGPGLVGGLLLPTLGALPDALVIAMSVIQSTDPSKLQDDLNVGMGTLVGSNVVLLTIPFSMALHYGNVPMKKKAGGLLTANYPSTKQHKHNKTLKLQDKQNKQDNQDNQVDLDNQNNQKTQDNQNTQDQHATTKTGDSSNTKPNDVEGEDERTTQQSSDTVLVDIDVATKSSTGIESNRVETKTETKDELSDSDDSDIDSTTATPPPTSWMTRDYWCMTGVTIKTDTKTNAYFMLGSLLPLLVVQGVAFAGDKQATKIGAIVAVVCCVLTFVWYSIYTIRSPFIQEEKRKLIIKKYAALRFVAMAKNNREKQDNSINTTTNNIDESQTNASSNGSKVSMKQKYNVTSRNLTRGNNGGTKANRKVRRNTELNLQFDQLYKICKKSDPVRIALKKKKKEAMVQEGKDFQDLISENIGKGIQKPKEKKVVQKNIQKKAVEMKEGKSKELSTVVVVSSSSSSGNSSSDSSDSSSSSSSDDDDNFDQPEIPSSLGKKSLRKIEVRKERRKIARQAKRKGKPRPSKKKNKSLTNKPIQSLPLTATALSVISEGNSDNGTYSNSEHADDESEGTTKEETGSKKKVDRQGTLDVLLRKEKNEKKEVQQKKKNEIKKDSKQDTKEGSKEDIKENTKQDTKQDTKESSKEGPEEGFKEETKKDIKKDIKKDTKKDIKEDSTTAATTTITTNTTNPKNMRRQQSESIVSFQTSTIRRRRRASSHGLGRGSGLMSPTAHSTSSILSRKVVKQAKKEGASKHSLHTMINTKALMGRQLNKLREEISQASSIALDLTKVGDGKINVRQAFFVKMNQGSVNEWSQEHKHAVMNTVFDGWRVALPLLGPTKEEKIQMLKNNIKIINSNPDSNEPENKKLIQQYKDELEEEEQSGDVLSVSYCVFVFYLPFRIFFCVLFLNFLLFCFFCFRCFFFLLFFSCRKLFFKDGL